MVKKEPRDAEPTPVPGPSDAAEAQRQRFTSWVQGLQHQGRSKASAAPPPARPPAAAEAPRSVVESEPPAVYHQLSEEIALLKAARLRRLERAADASSLPPSSSPLVVSTPISSPNVMASSNTLPSSKPPPPPSSRPSSKPTSSRITAPTPVAAWAPGSLTYGEELPADELTAVFAPPPELLARSGAHAAAPGTWEEPTQVVHLDNVLGTFAASQSQPPAGQGPTLEQLDFERRLVVLATPIPAAPGRARWLLWALITVLLGAAAAAFLEYSLHPRRLGAVELELERARAVHGTEFDQVIVEPGTNKLCDMNMPPSAELNVSSTIRLAVRMPSTRAGKSVTQRRHFRIGFAS